MGDFHTTSMCRFMVATQAALWPLATAPAATRHRRMQITERGDIMPPRSVSHTLKILWMSTIMYDYWSHKSLFYGAPILSLHRERGHQNSLDRTELYQTIGFLVQLQCKPLSTPWRS